MYNPAELELPYGDRNRKKNSLHIFDLSKIMEKGGVSVRKATYRRAPISAFKKKTTTIFFCFYFNLTSKEMPCPAKIELPKTPGEFKLNLLSPTTLPQTINNKLSGMQRIRHNFL